MSAGTEESWARPLGHRVAWEDLDPEANRALVRRALEEDAGGLGFRERPEPPGDVTSDWWIPAAATTAVEVVAREPVTVAGLPLAAGIVAEVDPALRWEPAVVDGTSVPAGAVLAHLSGPARSLLTAERTVLNFLQLLSGIATNTAALAGELAGSPTRLLDTRKTIPGYRALCKYAVACGGGWNHRRGLYDQVLLKDNHLATGEGEAEGAWADALAARVAAFREGRPEVPLEVEIDRLEDLEAVVAAGVDAVLLDNFPVEDLRRAVELVAGRCQTEASGGIDRARLRELAAVGLDYVSTGATVHQSVWVDLAFDTRGAPCRG